VSLTKEKNKSLLINNINLIFHIQGKIIQEFINVPNIKKNNKCKSFIILNNEKEILKYESFT